MFKKYDSIEDYNADTLAPDEKRVSLIMDRDYVVDVKYDAPMREVTLPAVGDALFIDSNGGKHFYRDAKPNIVPGLTLVGFVFNVKGNKVKILEKTEQSLQWLACWQYAITEITQTDITLGFRMAPDYTVVTSVAVNLQSTNINKDNADAISSAVAAAGGSSWWAYLADANGNKVDSNGTQIIVQTDSSVNYLQRNVTGTNCSIALCVYKDMLASSVLLNNNQTASASAVLNVSRSVSYYNTNGATPSSNVAVNSTTIVKLSSYKTSSYCAALRAKYGDGDTGYENYIKANGAKYPQRYGVFNLPDASEMTRLYGNATAPTKTDGVMYKFPALHHGATIGYNSEGLTAGNWHIFGVADCIECLDDDVLSLVKNSQSNMSITQINNTSYKWLAQRGTLGTAWVYQQDGLLTGSYDAGYVNLSRLCYVVCELTLSFPSNNQNS